jgi:hypothetical protein
MRLMGRAVVLLAFCAALIGPVAAFAQEPSKIQAGGGYLYLVDPWAAFNSPVHPDSGHGWFAKVVGNATPHFGAVGEATGSYYDAFGHKGVRGAARIHSVLGGVRVRACCRVIAPFAHAVAGMVHSRFRSNPQLSSASDATERHFGMAFGGGADVRGIHVATDLMRVAHHADYSAWTWRIAAGVMLPGR